MQKSTTRKDYNPVNKTKSQRVHAKHRAAERLGLHLNRDDLKALVAQIQKGQATFVRKQSNRVSEFLVVHERVQCRVIYDKLRKSIVTFLPQETT